MNPLMFILWGLILIFIGFPVGFFCAWVYVIALCCGVCFKSCIAIEQILEKGVKLPKYCAEKAMA
eukprot:UN02224